MTVHGRAAESLAVKRVPPDSSVATVVNRSPVGQPFALSEIVRAAASVQGVTAATVLSPTYTGASDVVSTRSDEKLLILDLENDVTVTFVSDT